MADYYPLLARAIGGLPDKSGEARKAVYERARRALLAQLRAVDPPLPEDDVHREQQALENAIGRLEAEHAGSGETVSSPVVPPVPPVSRPAPDVSAAKPAPEGAEAPEVGAAGRHDWRSDAARMVRAREAGATEYADETEAAENDIGEPQQEEAAPARGGRGKLVALLAFLLLLIAAGAVGYTQRETILALVGGQTAPRPAAQAPARPATPETQKSTDRITQAPDSSRPATSAPSNAPSEQDINAPQRAVLFEESPGGGEQGLQQYVGTVKWSTETSPASNGQAPDIGIRGDITIPARDIAVTLTLRRNQDPSIPASHIIEVQFRLPQNFDLGNVSNVPGMRAKASEGAQGAPLVGLAVRVAPGFFLIGLSALDADIQRNLAFLITRNWLDLPIVFENGRRAILVLEKGAAGNAAFRKAFTEWGLAVPPEQENN